MTRRATPWPLLAAALFMVFVVALAGAHAGNGWLGLTLHEALERLRAAGLNVVYSSELVRPEMRVMAEPISRTPHEILEALLAPHDLAAVPGAGETIVVVKAPPRQPSRGTIHGRIVTAESRVPLTGVLITLVGRSHTAVSDGDGRFALASLPAGSYTVSVNATGFGEAVLRDVTVTAGGTADVVVELVPQPRFLQEIVVTPSHYGLLQAEPESRQFLLREEVQRLPHLSDDVFRVLHWLPGTVAGDFSASFGLRGGTPDEVLIVLDGVQLYEPYHLREFQKMLSIIDAETVSSVDLVSGGFPAEFGDHMSGVVEFTSAAPSRSRHALGASLFIARGLIEGTNDSQDQSWLVSLRRGTLDWAFRWAKTIDSEPDFEAHPVYYDVYATHRHIIDTDQVLSLHLLGSRDNGIVDDDDGRELLTIRDTSWHVWMKLHSRWTPAVSTRTVLSAVHLSQNRGGHSDNPGRSYTEVKEDRSLTVFGLKQDLLVQRSQNALWKLGLDARYSSASYLFVGHGQIYDPLATQDGPPRPFERAANLRPGGWQLSLWTAHRRRLAPGVTVETGLRWDRQTWTPGANQLSPRVNVVWEASRQTTLRAAWGRFAQSQGLHQLQVEDGINEFFPAQWAEHRIASVEHLFGSGVALRLEAYDKRMQDLRPRFENLFEPVDVLPEGEADRTRIDAERARSRGLELVLKGPPGRRWSWFAGVARTSTEELVDGDWRLRPWDQPLSFSMSIGLRAGSSWNLNLAGTFRSGWPTTPVTAHWVQREDGTWTAVPQLGEVNSERYPSYRRVDLRVSRTFSLPKGLLRCFFEITNLFDYDNVRATTDLQAWGSPSGRAELGRDYEDWLPVLPSLGISWEF